MTANSQPNCVESPATPLNPRNAAISAITKNTSA